MSKQRNKSSIYNLRLFHNWVKRELITDAVYYLKDNYKIEDISLLDLAVGKGGDMRKWYDNNIYKVVGIDIDDESITGKNGAKHRYHSFLKEKNNKATTIPDYSFFVYDLSDPKNITYYDEIIKNSKFNIVSCNFAIHYFFKNKESLNTLIKVVKKYIHEKGVFIGTTLDGTKLKKLFESNSTSKQYNREYFYLKDLSVNSTNYGNKVTVSLGKTNNNNNGEEEHYFSEKPSEEYLVFIDELKKVCSLHNLRFIGTTTFEKWYYIYMKTQPKYELSDGEKEFSFLNFSFLIVAN